MIISSMKDKKSRTADSLTHHRVCRFSMQCRCANLARILASIYPLNLFSWPSGGFYLPLRVSVEEKSINLFAKTCQHARHEKSNRKIRKITVTVSSAIICFWSMLLTETAFSTPKSKRAVNLASALAASRTKTGILHASKNQVMDGETLKNMCTFQWSRICSSNYCEPHHVDVHVDCLWQSGWIYTYCGLAFLIAA